MTTELIGLPDADARRRKALFRLVRDLYTEVLSAELDSRPNAALRVAIHGGPEGLAQAIGSQLGSQVSSFEPAARPASSYHAMCWHLTGAETPATRVRQLRELLAGLRPSALVVLVARVVADDAWPKAPSIATLVEELTLTSGDALYAEDVQSIRWPGEQLVTGVRLTLRYLGTAA